LRQGRWCGALIGGCRQVPRRPPLGPITKSFPPARGSREKSKTRRLASHFGSWFLLAGQGVLGVGTRLRLAGCISGNRKGWQWDLRESLTALPTRGTPPHRIPLQARPDVCGGIVSGTRVHPLRPRRPWKMPNGPIMSPFWGLCCSIVDTEPIWLARSAEPGRRYHQ
jgi:hypothetical protein